MGHYRGRRDIETTFQESRAHLGLEATRAAPCLLGLDTAVARMSEARPESERSGAIALPGKSATTFSDALA